MPEATASGGGPNAAEEPGVDGRGRRGRRARRPARRGGSARSTSVQAMRPGPVEAADGGAAAAALARRRHHDDLVARGDDGLGQRVEPGSLDAVVVGDEDAHRPHATGRHGLAVAATASRASASGRARRGAAGVLGRVVGPAEGDEGVGLGPALGTRPARRGRAARPGPRRVAMLRGAEAVAVGGVGGHEVPLGQVVAARRGPRPGRRGAGPRVGRRPGRGVLDGRPGTTTCRGRAQGPPPGARGRRAPCVRAAAAHWRPWASRSTGLAVDARCGRGEAARAARRPAMGARLGSDGGRRRVRSWLHCRAPRRSATSPGRRRVHGSGHLMVRSGEGRFTSACDHGAHHGSRHASAGLDSPRGRAPVGIRTGVCGTASPRPRAQVSSPRGGRAVGTWP